MIRNVFIDLDDTLWDTFANNRRSLEMLYKEYLWSEYVSTFDQFFEVYYPNNELLWDDYRNDRITKEQLSYLRFARPFQHFSMPIAEESIATLNRHFLDLSQHQTSLVDGAEELLQELKAKGYRVMIITNGFEEIQFNKMKNSGIDQYIDQLFVSEKLGSHKPNIGFFHFALTGSNSRREETVVIGDSLEADIKGADNARLHSIWFNPQGKSLTIPITFSSPLVVNSLKEVPKAIEQINY